MFLITGANGFLGSHLTCHLVKAGFRVKAMKRATSRMEEFNYIASLYFENQQEYKDQITWVEADVNDLFSLEDALQDIDHVIHAAALVSFHAQDRHKLIEVNREGTANLVNTCLSLGIKKFFYISSTAAIGASKPEEEANEKSEWKLLPNTSRYSVSKYLAEMEVWRGAEEGLSVCMVNPSIILGPGIWKRGTCKLFDHAYHNFPFYSTGTNAFVDVGDVCQAVLFLIDKKIEGQRYLLHGTNASFEEVFALMAKAFNKKPPYIKINKSRSNIAWRLFYVLSLVTRKRGLITKESAQSSVKIQAYNSDKIKQLGFAFTPLTETISGTCDAYKKKLPQ